MKHRSGKQNMHLMWTAGVLLLCVIVSASILFSQIAGFTAADKRHYIPLTRSAGLTDVAVVQQGAVAAPQSEIARAGKPALMAMSPVLATAWFQAYDKNTVWSGETDVEIFRVSYENGEGAVTVRSADGEKVIAPGTENTYEFALENTSRENVEYTMTMEAYFSHGEYPIPVEARVYNGNRTYLAGSAEGWADVLALNGVKDSRSLQPGYVMPYTLQWQWPFVGDDEYDTFLGNLAAEGEDLTLTIVIKTIASYTPTATDGVPKTGDTGEVLMYSLLLLASIAGLLLVLLFAKKKREDEDE